MSFFSLSLTHSIIHIKFSFTEKEQIYISWIYYVFLICSVFMGLFFAFTRDCHWMTAYFCFIVQQTSSLSSYFHKDFSVLLMFIILFTPFSSTAIILLSFNIFTYYIHIIYIKNMGKKIEDIYFMKL